MTAPPTPSSGPSDPAPQASVVVAAFGRTRKTIACIESLLAQRGVAAETIVVDDGSPDGTADAVAELLAHEAALLCHGAYRCFRPTICSMGGTQAGHGTRGRAGHCLLHTPPVR